MTTVLLVRHGESEANLAGVFAGCCLDASLTSRGVEQARLYAQYVVENYKIDAVYSSPLIRAYNTGKATADLLGLDVTVRDGLREINGGVWEGMTLREIREKYPEEFYIWVNDISACKCVNGEKVSEMGDRVLSALTEIAKENDGKTVLVATHYTPVRAMQSYASTGSFDAMQNFAHIPNASVTEFFYDGNWSVGRINIDSYFEELSEVQ